MSTICGNLIFTAIILLCLLPGCATKWAMHTLPGETYVSFPQSSQATGIRHVLTIDGFEETGSSLSRAAKNILYGKNGGSRIVKPVAVAEGADGRLAIADPGSRSIHLFLPVEERYIRVDRIEDEDLVSPVGVVFDDEMRLYFTDSVLNRIFVLDREGRFLYSIDKLYLISLKRPTGLAYNGKDKILYAIDTLENKIAAYSAGGNTKGETLFAVGERGTKKGQFNYPTHLFFSGDGLLYVTDAMNFRIQMFGPYGDFKTEFGHHGDGSGDFAMPKGVAADKKGIVYVVDSLFDNVQLFDRTGRFLLSFGNRGVQQGEFWLPSGIYIDRENRVYVCDTFNGRVQVYQIMGE